MLGERLRLARKGAGLSLRGLAERLGGLVTAQALGKYERGEMLPSSAVLIGLSAALGVPESYLLSGADLQLRDVEFRKHALSRARDRDHLQAKVLSLAERYLDVETLLGHPSAWTAPDGFPRRVANPDDAEAAARALRNVWRLGEDPIPGLADFLEERGILVASLELAEAISGMTARIRRRAASDLPMIVVNVRHPGERQRFTFAHELGHLLLGPVASADTEKLCNRFAGAFLVPAEPLRAEVGRARKHVSLGELIRLKALFLVSMQCLVYRMCDLGILAPAAARQVFQSMSRRGYRKAEPNPLPSERAQRFERLCLRVLSEGLASEARVAELLGVSVTRLEAMADAQAPV
jgi:Zn-dependent peptidase ImmA (M78 family)